MRTNSNEFKRIMNQYLLEALNNNDNPLNNFKDVANYSFNRFNSEYCHNYEIKRTPNVQNRLADYLRGIPFNVDFENYRIIELAKEWGQLPQNATEKQENKIINNWFNFIAHQILNFWSRNGIDWTIANKLK